MRSYLEGIFAANVIFRSYRSDSVAGQRNATQNRLFTTVCGGKTIQLSNKSGCDCLSLSPSLPSWHVILSDLSFSHHSDNIITFHTFKFSLALPPCFALTISFQWRAGVRVFMCGCV